MTGVSARVEEALASSQAPLTVREIAQALGVPPDEIAEVVWSAPQSFSWQPGGRWALAIPKAPVVPPAEPSDDDARAAVLDPKEGVELQAFRLESGVVLRVIRNALDSSAVFTVRSVGSDLQLILNSAHPVFERLPIPFEDSAGDYKALTELLLAAWAIHEGEAPTGAKRDLEDARLFWGRRLLDLLDSWP